MTRSSIIISFLFISGLASGQTEQQTDSIEKAFLKTIQKSPLPDSTKAMNVKKQRIPDPLIFANIKKYKVKVSPQIFETAYFKGTSIIQDSLTINFYSVEIGKLNIETGKIIACDPIAMRDMKPFTQAFPVGQFPVQLAVAKIGNDERVAFSRIYFSDKPVVKWEFALDSGKRQIPIDGETIYGYGVDGGIGLFIDAKANTEFTSMSRSNEYLWSTVFTDEMVKNYRNTWTYILYNFQGHNLASFSTGYGDGHFGTYVGYDDKGQPCRLITDFGLVSWWKK